MPPAVQEMYEVRVGGSPPTRFAGPIDTIRKQAVLISGQLLATGPALSRPPTREQHLDEEDAERDQNSGSSAQGRRPPSAPVAAGPWHPQQRAH